MAVCVKWYRFLPSPRMQQAKYGFVVCVVLCFIGLAIILNVNDSTRNLLEKTFTVPGRQYSRFSKHALFSNILSSGHGAVSFLNGSLFRAATSSKEGDLVPGDFPQAPELSLAQVVIEERKYTHDDQYLKYLQCPTTVRKKMMSDPVVGRKFVPDMPILMSDKHFNSSEYTRLTQFGGIFGWRNMNYTDVHGMLAQLNSANNDYMFDDRLGKMQEAGQPGGNCIRCAVVGNGGIMNGSGKGEEIDAHDYVFRVNAAITKGYEKDVGTRTSFYCFTMVTLHNTMALRGKTGFAIPKGDEKLRYLFFADTDWTYTYLSAALAGKPLPKSTGKYHRGPPTFPRQLTAENVKVLHPDFERYLKWSWVNSTAQHKSVHRPTTGAIMLLAALHTCDEVSLYGFAGSYSTFSEHYYDKKYARHVNYANHDNGAENKLWELLEKQGIVKLYRREMKKRRRRK